LIWDLGFEIWDLKFESAPKTLFYRKERKVCAKAAKENGYQHF
jgi:hypothetical protein